MYERTKKVKIEEGDESTGSETEQPSDDIKAVKR
jgi:hypothetical protein